MNTENTINAVAIGCWLLMLVGTIAFWSLVAYGVWVGIQYIQTLG